MMLHGRNEERDRVLRLLDAGEALVTLTGPPGVGKTALAEEIAKSRPKVRFLDEATADAITRTDEAQILVASRERLQLPFEHVVELGPLGVDVAAAMFVAEARKRGRDVAPADMPFVLDIVRTVDQLPLAIELAASRLSVMSPRALLHRLRTSLSLLATGDGGVRGLDAALKGAFDALLDVERDALGQLCVFRGGFRLDSAEAVVDVPGVMNVVASLRDKSLLTEREPGRLDMLSLVRARARTIIDETSRVAAEQRHSEHFAALAEQLARGDRALLVAERENILAVAERLLLARPVTARHAEPALQALAALGEALLDAGPLEAFEAALLPTLVATQGSGARPALEAAAVLTRGALRLRHGDVTGASHDLVQALGVARTTGDTALEARATLELGRALDLRADLAHALEHFERAAASFDALRWTVDHGRALEAAGLVLSRMGRDSEALALLDRAVASTAASPFDLASATLARASVRLDSGLEDEVPTEQGWRSLAARATALRGLALHDRGDTAAAIEAYESALADMRSLGASRQAARVEILAALVRRELGHSGDAYVLLKSALATLRDSDPAGAALASAHLSVLELEAARPDQARALLAGVVPLDVETNDVVAVAHTRLDPSKPMADARTAHGRIARRVWEHGPSAHPSRPPDDALLVGPSGAWFCMPGQQRTSLQRRRNLALVLALLAQERLVRPGQPLPSAALLAAGWPGEKVIATAGAHRVRVAIATLRKLGLKDVIATVSEGYALSAGVPLAFVDFDPV